MMGRFLILSGWLLLTACTSMHTQDTLYQRLGGEPAVTAVVDDFIGRVAEDRRINDFFEGIDIANLKKLLVEQICAGTGGPCRYTGRDMKSVHDEFSIEEKHFNAMVEDLVATLNHFKVPEREQQELLAVLGPMKVDIVNTQ